MMKMMKTLTGVVTSDKMNKTITVAVMWTYRHPKFKRVVKGQRKFKAHDEKMQAKVGDTVRIALTRPISKTKHWRLLEVVRK